MSGFNHNHMGEQTFKTRLKGLPVREKLILIGGLLTIIGTFLPWYQDLDRFNTGDTFLGVSGPLYLAGLIVLLGGIMSFGIIMLKLLNRKLPKMPLPESYMHLSSSALSILMLILAYSVYFHPKFGTNLTEKVIGIGMLMDFIGIGFVVLGGIFTIKKRDISFETEGKIEPLINIEERTQGELKRPEPEFQKPVERSPFGTQETLNEFLEKTEINNQQ